MTRLDHEQGQVRTSGTAFLMKSLVERARVGDTTAFEQLLDLFHEEVFRMVYYRTRSFEDSEDLTQEIFVQAYRKVSKLQDPCRFRPWLFTIAVNRVRDFHRKKGLFAFFHTSAGTDELEESEGAISKHDGPVDRLMRQELWEKIDSVLGRLSRLDREVFILRFMDHLTIREICQVLGKSESAIKTHLYRALQKLRRESTLLEFFQED
jgi:RNA polymerase sigma-70 factor (ECF subfamily)